MYPHTITIFRLINNNGVETYYKKIIKDVLWYGNTGVAISGNGLVDSNSLNIFIPKESLTGYATEWHIEKKDRIVKGIADDVNSFNDLKKYDDVLIVKKIDIYDFDTNLDSVLITGE